MRLTSILAAILLRPVQGTAQSTSTVQAVPEQAEPIRELYGGSLHLLAPLPLPADEVAVLRQKRACIDPAAFDSAVPAGTLDVLPSPIE
jgi:hypothetical protein